MYRLMTSPLRENPIVCVVFKNISRWEADRWMKSNDIVYTSTVSGSGPYGKYGDVDYITYNVSDYCLYKSYYVKSIPLLSKQVIEIHFGSMREPTNFVY